MSTDHFHTVSLTGGYSWKSKNKFISEYTSRTKSSDYALINSKTKQGKRQYLVSELLVNTLELKS